MESGVLTGRTVGHYEILESLGEGGMGVVYRARDLRLGRPVALKVVRPDRAGDAEGRRRFVREARTASSLNHPNILVIYEIGDAEGVDYIAMEYVPGGTLADLIAKGPVPVDRVFGLARQVVDALAAAHAAGIVHRDLKPSNIMLAAGDRVKVVDFGLARQTAPSLPSDETSDLVTRGGAVLGTAAYMSPEQAAGRSLDARSDLFSLGTILYEMLSGLRPFRGDSPAGTLAAILRDPPPPLESVDPRIVRIVERCLSKDVTGRFQTAAELREALEACFTAPAALRRPSIAVLPFANMSGAKEDDFLCEGLAEEIIDALTRVPGLRVIARTSAFAVGRAERDVREVGARLDVGSVLEGSVRRSGRRVRVTAQLVKTTDGSHLWSERFDRELTDVLALEDEIAGAIARRLRIELAGAGPGRPHAAVDPDAYAAYLEGRYYFARGTPEALGQAARSYTSAIARDPGFALAYDSLAELHWFLGFFGNAPPREAFSQSTWHALRALELDDTLAQTHALLGMLRKELDYDWAEVDRELDRAFELNRDSPLVRLRRAISGLLPHGRVDEALAELEDLVRDDPLSLILRWWLSVMAFLGRRAGRVAEEGRHMIALDATNFLGHWALGIAFDLSGAPGDAVACLEKAHELSGGSPFAQGFLAFAYGRAGRREDARRLLALAEKAATAGHVPASTFFLSHIGLGDWDAAFEWMDRAVETRDPLIMPIRTYPFLDQVRDDPRYRSLVKKMRLD